jgi:hypothetical protein
MLTLAATLIDFVLDIMLWSDELRHPAARGGSSSSMPGIFEPFGAVARRRRLQR